MLGKAAALEVVIAMAAFITPALALALALPITQDLVVPTAHPCFYVPCILLPRECHHVASVSRGSLMGYPSSLYRTTPRSIAGAGLL